MTHDGRRTGCGARHTRLLVGLGGIFGIEAGTGGDVPFVDTTQMGLKDILVPVLLWIFAEKMGIDLQQLQKPASENKGI